MDRRNFIRRATAVAAGLAIGGCDRLTTSPAVNKVLNSAESLNYRVRRALTRRALASEYPASAISAQFRANGTTSPQSDVYQKLAADSFSGWQLEISGLVEQPLRLSLEELRAAPSRTQITRHDCVEGWSCIGKWRGAVLGELLERVGLKDDARYLAFFCADSIEEGLGGSSQYYETIDLDDAYHPQTILAYEMNDRPLPIAHGAPLRLRLERQLGYKMAKYVMKIEAIHDFRSLGLGQGGYWEDRGYQWDASI